MDIYGYIYIYIIQIHMIRIDSLDDLHKAQPRPGSYQQVWEAASKAASRLSDAAKIRPATTDYVGLMNTGSNLTTI